MTRGAAESLRSRPFSYPLAKPLSRAPELLDKRLELRSAIGGVGDDKNRVVAGNRAKRMRETGIIHRGGHT